MSEPMKEADAVRLVIEHGKNAAFALIGRIDQASPLYAAISPAFESERRRRVAAPNRVPTQSAAVLPPDFEAAIQWFADKTKVVQRTRQERGHRYSELTVRKREVDARHFCEFLARQGLQYWPEVSQHHLDLFVEQANNKAGERAHTFLLQVRRKFRMTQHFVRPRFRRKPSMDALLGADAVPQVLARVVACEDLQVAVATLLLTLWGQTIARCHGLTYGNFRAREGKIQVLFAEQWTVLDTFTTKYLRRLHPTIGTDNKEADETPVFTCSIWQLNAKVRKLVGLPVRKLRLTAVANLIRAGIKDRGSIARILGVSMGTVAYVESAFPWDLQMTVDPEMVASRNEVIRGERTE